MEPWEEVVASQRWAEARKVEEVRARFEQDAAQDKARVEAQQAEAQAAKQEEERRERPPAVLGGAYRRVDEPEDSFVVDVPITEVGGWGGREVRAMACRRGGACPHAGRKLRT